MSKSLMAEIRETEQLLEEYYELNEGLLAEVAELKATITKLTGALKDIYSVTNEMQVMSIVMANLPTPKTIPPKENDDVAQEQEDYLAYE